MASILLIEDDDAVRSVVRRTLARFGHPVIEACNGKEGLKLFPQSNFDLVITDMLMACKDGIEVLMELRKKRPPVKIIAISGGGRANSENYLKLAKQIGATKVLAKPFPSETLIAMVNELMSGSDSSVGSP